MDDKALNDFRAKWLSEIRKPNADSQGKNNETLPGSSAKYVEHASTIISTTKNDCSFTAFDIANSYLSQSSMSQCTYCKDGWESKKRKLSDSFSQAKSDDVLKEEQNKRHNNEELQKNSLVDLLIADIDEIHCVPFFDIELPRELALGIFQYLSVKDLSQCSLVNRKWKQLAEDDLLWYKLCPTLDVPRDVSFLSEKLGWKTYIKDFLLKRKRLRRKWKERHCRVSDLENEKGGILCCVNIFETILIAAYLDGTVKLWDLISGSHGMNLKERYTNDEDIITSMCTAACVSSDKAVAGFQNGDVMIWKRKDLEGQLIYMQNFSSSEIVEVKICVTGALVCVVLQHQFAVLQRETSAGEWAWKAIDTSASHEKIINALVVESSCGQQVVFCTRDELLVRPISSQNEQMSLDRLVGATFSHIDQKNEFIVAGINSFGYSVYGGYRLRRYYLSSGKQCSNVIGLPVSITCLNYSGCHSDKILVGCSDHKLRLHDFQTETLLLTINGVNTEITALQMDQWKVVSGHMDGTVCLWDAINGTLYWKTHQKHPVRMCLFTDSLLVSANLPVDKFPRNSYWHAEDLTQHRKYRGSIRVMDFTKETHFGHVPSECLPEYDNITGYDYNIQLIAPYDDVQTFNLPQI